MTWLTLPETAAMTWLTLPEAAAILNVAPNTIMVWAKNGKIIGIRDKKKDKQKGQNIYWKVYEKDILEYYWKNNKIQYYLLNIDTGEIILETNILKHLYEIYKTLDSNKYSILDTLGHTYKISEKKIGMISLPIDDLFFNLDFIHPEFPPIKIKNNIIKVDEIEYVLKDKSEKTIINWLETNFDIPFNLYKIYLFTKKIIIE